MNEDLFWAKVEKTETCWLWTAATCNGYGRFNLSRGKSIAAHRLAYELLVGPIPDGLHLDHLCRVRHCVRPEHLEPVTQSENNRRALAVNLSDECPKGHLFDEENTYRHPTKGYRVCRACRREAMRLTIVWKRIEAAA